MEKTATMTWSKVEVSLPIPNELKMKVAVVTSFLFLMASSVLAFAPSAAFSRGIATQVFATDPEEEEGLDLNLEEMFDMYVN